MTAPSSAVTAGSTLQLAASGTYSDGTLASLTSQVAWKASDSTIATVAANGLVSAIKSGSVTLTATMDGVSGTFAVTVGQATLASIAVSGASLSPTAGTTEQLSAEGTYSDASTQALTSQVTWQSSDNTVATVNSAGLLSAVNAGPVTITATISTVSGTLDLTVVPVGGGSGNPPTLASISISPSVFTIASAQTKQLAAQGVYSDGTTQDVTAQVTWTSNAANFVSVGATGLATGVSPGTATITATLGSISASATGTVNPITLNTITVTPATASIAIGQTQAFTANGIFSDGSSTDMTDSVTWSSNASNLASINATGLATGLAAGTTSIVATSGSVTGSASLTVTPATLVSIDISPDGQSIPIGGQYQLTLTGSYSDNTTQTITNATWSSSDSSTATVDSNTGLVTGVASSNGNPVTITATAGGQSNTTTVYVTSAAINSIVLTPATSSIAKGTTQQYAVNAIYTDGTIQPLSEGLTWTSSAPSVAGISASGLATGVGTGQTTITVSDGPISATAALVVTPATLTAIVVTPTVPTIGINGNLQFTATGVFSDASTEDLSAIATWNSSAATVALVNSSGLASALSAGTTSISAAYEGVSGSTTLTVSTATLVSINITPANPIAPPHVHIQMTAIGTFSDGSTATLSGVRWSTNTGRYATISGSGVLRTKKATKTAVPIYARFNGILGQTSLTITTMSVTSLSLTPTNPTIAVGTTQAFSLIGTFSDGVTTVDLSNSAQWQTSNYREAVMNRSGVATGRAAGSVTITGSYGTLGPATTSLTVSNATIQSIAVTPAATTVILGAPQQFTAVGSFSDGSTQDITSISQWSSSSPAVAVVNQNGTAFSASHGQTNIAAKYNGVTGSTSLNVN